MFAVKRKTKDNLNRLDKLIILTILKKDLHKHKKTRPVGE
jgi:hypothetical protein